MNRLLPLLRRSGRDDHRAVFSAFADGLKRVLRPKASPARIRAVKL